ncbi:hypothetical protein OG423_32120 [Micromonospora zamorensis]|uniref:hypothetical protein n=1 Tax=Micromonospora zamorensis TaxID=709883 RepID=UPI00352A64B1|nr:hypothetical protein OG423_32120 [Micromonospora zamorensis]
MSTAEPARADALRRAAYTIAAATQQVEAALAHAPANTPTWADLRWAHARLTAVLRLAPDPDQGEPPEHSPSPTLPAPQGRQPYGTRVPRNLWPLELEAAGWLHLEVRASRRWVPPGSDGRRSERMTLTDAWAALRAQGGGQPPPSP